MQRFRRMKTLQKFSSAHAQVHNHFNQERHLVDRQTYKLRRSAALAEWHRHGVRPAPQSRPSANRRQVRVSLTAPRAMILKIDLRTNRETMFASGLRNPVGMDIEPRTRSLWTAVNERDHLGDDLVPDYITIVKQGAFYGWPWSYYGQYEDPRLKGQRPEMVARAIAPDYAVGAHASALGILFGNRLNFPARYRQGAFVARHGSWNRSRLNGYDVSFVPFRNGKPAGALRPFLSGFASEAAVHGRPRALVVAKDGALLIVDDASNAIWRVTRAD